MTTAMATMMKEDSDDRVRPFSLITSPMNLRQCELADDTHGLRINETSQPLLRQINWSATASKLDVVHLIDEE